MTPNEPELTLPINLPVTAVEGIGPATAERLARIGVHRVVDLFFVSDAEAHRACADAASFAEVESWREMAALMEVHGVDGQRAEALAQGGIETVEELAGKSLADLAEIFETAVRRGSLPERVDVEAVASMRVSATRIEMGGVAMGHLLDADDRPVEGAVLRSDLRSATTDARGRFRIAGTPPGTNRGLRVEIEGQPPQWVELGFVYDPRLIGGPNIRLATEPQSMLDEFEGERLPPLSGVTTRTLRFENDAPREGEVLQVHGLYTSSDDVKGVSIFRAYEAGQLIVRKARLPRSLFEGAPPEVGQVYRHRQGRLRRVAGGIGAVEMFRAGRRATRALRESGEDLASLEAPAAISRLGQALSAEAFFNPATANPMTEGVSSDG